MAEQESSYFEHLEKRELKPITKIGNSELMMFKDCNWKYKMHRMGIRSRMPYLPFAVGSMLHLGMAVMYSKGITSVKHPKFEPMMEILEAKWNRNIAVNMAPEYINKLQRQWFVVRGIFYGMMYQHIIEKDLDIYEVIQTESKLEAPLLYNMVWTGTPDIVLKHKSTKEYTHFDHKSTSRLTDSSVKHLHTGVELEGDKFLIEQAHGVRLKRGFYNIVVKLYLYERKNEDKGSYAQRILEQYREEKFHFRYQKLYTEQSYADWLKQQGNWIKQIHVARSNNNFPRNDQSCVGFYDCQFLDLCSKRTDVVFRLQYEKLIPKKLKKKGKK